MLSYLVKCWVLLSVCDEWLNDFVCAPILDAEEAVYWSLLLLLICTVDIKHTRDGVEELIAPRLHSA